MTILQDIYKYKQEELEHFKRQVRLEELKARARDARKPASLISAITDTQQPHAIIAEIKRRSPSKGLLREDFDPVAIARDYEENGAVALSILTDEHFFGGHLDHLREVRRAVALPLLRKDFVWDPYQIYAALDGGADAVLLIVAMLQKNQLADLKGLAEELGLSVLVEVHNAGEAAAALEARSELVGINNRDLKTFKVEIETTEKLIPLFPSKVVKVSESGIDSLQTLRRLKDKGVQAFLIGETFMKAEQPGEALRELIRQ